MGWGGANREPSRLARLGRLRLARTPPWYVPPALEARTTAIVCAACALLLPACGSAKKQDEDERAGNYELEVVEASFPDKQKLAKRSEPGHPRAQRRRADRAQRGGHDQGAE